MVFSQLSNYLSQNNLLDPFQSGYRPGHSVETLLLNVSNFILTEMDAGFVTCMVLLDLSSAFDTVDHTIILNTLTSLGVRGQAYEWFRSYLNLHSQIVYLKGCSSSPMHLTCGVPQGSVGGPTLFSIYLLGLRPILQRHSVNYHIYADDIQLYVSFRPLQSAADESLKILESCINDINSWMHSHSLQLNQSKCEFLLFGSKTQLSKFNVSSISISGKSIPVASSCRNLGVFLDSQFNMNVQITNICKSVRYQLRNIGFIRKYLTRSATEKLVHALISSRIDFGNSLLYNIPNAEISKLQKLQNAAARIVTLTPKHCHITQTLQNLHWLPVKQRIIFKILLLVFHCVHGTAPQYNSSLLQNYTPIRSLRSSNLGLLQIPNVKKNHGVNVPSLMPGHPCGILFHRD